MTPFQTTPRSTIFKTTKWYGEAELNVDFDDRNGLINETYDDVSSRREDANDGLNKYWMVGAFLLGVGLLGKRLNKIIIYKTIFLFTKLL